MGIETPLHRIAYLTNQYPKVSHSFIRREIAALEGLGFAVERIALRGWDEPLADEQDLRERARTHYVLERGILPLLTAALREFARSPARFLSALSLAVRTSRGSDRPLPYHLAYFCEACYLSGLLRSAGASHLHAHFGTNSAEVAMLARALGGPAYSFTVHGPDEFDRARFLSIGEKVRRSAFVVAVSSFGRSQLYRWVEHPHWHKIKVVPCGLEDAFCDVPPAAPPDTPRLVCVGRLCDAKGQLLLLEATEMLARKGIHFDLVLAGDGELRPQLERVAERLGVRDRLRITGWISSARVREEILAARALVLPSFAEGLPVVIMEAMALRRPVLTTYVAGIPELVRPGENGWLVAPGDVEGLAGAMEDALSRPAQEMRAMGEAARERVLRRHSVTAAAMRLASLFGDPLALVREAA